MTYDDRQSRILNWAHEHGIMGQALTEIEQIFSDVCEEISGVIDNEDGVTFMSTSKFEEIIKCLREARMLAGEWRRLWDMNVLVPNDCCPSGACNPPVKFPWEVGDE